MSGAINPGTLRGLTPPNPVGTWSTILPRISMQLWLNGITSRSVGS